MKNNNNNNLAKELTTIFNNTTRHSYKAQQQCLLIGKRYLSTKNNWNKKVLSKKLAIARGERILSKSIENLVKIPREEHAQIINAVAFTRGAALFLQSYKRGFKQKDVAAMHGKSQLHKSLY